jgi:hypothetical protein
VHVTEGGVFVGAPHRELVHVRLADDHGVGPPQPGHRVGVVGRPVAGQHPRGAGGGEVGRAEGVFDGDGESGEGPERLAGLAAGVDRGRLVEGPLTIHGQKGVHPTIHRRDPVEKGLGAGHGRQVARPHGGDQVDG